MSIESIEDQSYKFDSNICIIEENDFLQRSIICPNNVVKGKNTTFP